MVRGPTYLKDRKKIPAGLTAFTLAAMDVVTMPHPVEHVSRFLPCVRCAEGGMFVGDETGAPSYVLCGGPCGALPALCKVRWKLGGGRRMTGQPAQPFVKSRLCFDAGFFFVRVLLGGTGEIKNESLPGLPPSHWRLGMWSRCRIPWSMCCASCLG